MDDLDDFLEYIDRQENVRERIAKRYIRDTEDPFTFYTDAEFVRRYRFRKIIVRDEILPLINNILMKNHNRGLPIAPITQLLITLRFFATGNFQLVTADLRSTSQATVSRCIKRVCVGLAENLANFVKFPNNMLQQQQNIRQFYEISHFPNVIGCIDCTHIRIANPGGDNGEIFRNRKGWFSVNVQVVAGPNLEIQDIDVRYPGSTHDSVIFDRSSVRVKFETNQLQGLLLGDSGYACRNYLLTPLLNPTTPREERYNRAHIQTRNIVERLFGIWKKRFPVLQRGLLCQLQTAVAVICSCALLHNIAMKNEDVPDDNPEVIEDVPNIQNQEGQGLPFRRAFIETHF